MARRTKGAKKAPGCGCGGGCCKANPALALLGNPPEGAVMFGQPRYMEYRHDEDPEEIVRYHDFGRGAQMWALPDGTVQIRDRNPRTRVWEDRDPD